MQTASRQVSEEPPDQTAVCSLMRMRAGHQAFASSNFRVELLCAALAHRRRLLHSAALALQTDGQGPQGPKHRPEQDSLFSWAKHVRRMNEAQFKLRYRMTYDAFMKLLDEWGVRTQLDHSSPASQKMASLAKWGVLVPAEVKLAITLRFLAGEAGKRPHSPAAAPSEGSPSRLRLRPSLACASIHLSLAPPPPPQPLRHLHPHHLFAALCATS